MIIPYLFLAIRIAVIALAIVCAIGGLVTIKRGSISLRGASQLKGTSARVAGAVLIVASIGMAIFGLFLLPGMLR